MKYSAINIDFNGVRFDPLGSRGPPYERIKFGYPLENGRFLLLSTNLAQRFSTGGPRTPGGPRRVARGSASKLSKILML